jgi:hypothetical protein
VILGRKLAIGLLGLALVSARADAANLVLGSNFNDGAQGWTFTNGTSNNFWNNSGGITGPNDPYVNAKDSGGANQPPLTMRTTAQTPGLYNLDLGVALASTPTPYLTFWALQTSQQPQSKTIDPVFGQIVITNSNIDPYQYLSTNTPLPTGIYAIVTDGFNGSSLTQNVWRPIQVAFQIGNFRNYLDNTAVTQGTWDAMLQGYDNVNPLRQRFFYLRMESYGSANDNFGLDNFGFYDGEVPEPGTYALIGAGLALLGFAKHRRRKA